MPRTSPPANSVALWGRTGVPYQESFVTGIGGGTASTHEPLRGAMHYVTVTPLMQA